MLNSILKKYKKFEDLFFIAGQNVKIKINGKIDDLVLDYGKNKEKKLFPVNNKIIDNYILSKHPNYNNVKENFLNKNISENNPGEIDFSINIDGSGFRVNLFKTNLGISAVLRLIPNKIPDFKVLDLPEHLLEIIKYQSGLVLVTGVTGSGKSTTLASLINKINENYNKHILTIEDPIEFKYKSIKSIITQREIGTNTISFTSALKSALREAPDIILVGEMRDRETIEIALKTAETGHLVFSTLHTFSAIQTIERILGNFSGNDQVLVKNSLANVLKVIISQKLIKNIEGTLSIVYEILYNDNSIANNIREGNILQIKNTAKTGDNRKKNIFLNESILIKLNSKKIKLEDALNYSYDRKELEDLINE